MQGLLLIVGGEPLRPVRRLASTAQESIDGAGLPTPAEPSLALSQPEVETLVAFAEALLEGRPFSSPERQYVLDHVEHRTKQGYLPLYRKAAHLLDQLAGGRFSSLDISRRSELMTRHRLTPSVGAPGEQLSASGAETHGVRTRVVPDLIDGYYGSPRGWAVVGYETFPGRCGDLARYTRAPDSS